MNTLIDGVVTVLVTPITEAGDICTDSLEKIVERQIESGVAGFWALGSTGEDLSLPYELKLKFVEKLVLLTDNRIPIIVGSGVNSISDNLDFYSRCADKGAKFVSYIHRDTKQSDNQMVHAASKLADSSPLPVYLYNNVQRGKEVNFNVLKLLSEHPNIKGVKYGARNHMPFIRACSLNSNDFQVMSAGNFFYSALCYGLTASTTSDANFIPSVYVRLKELFDAGSLAHARDLQQRVISLLQHIPRNGNGESSAEIKEILFQQGLCTRYVNDTYQLLNNEDRNRIENILPHLNNLNEECKTQ